MPTLIEKLRYLADCGQEELGSVPVSLLRDAANALENMPERERCARIAEGFQRGPKGFSVALDIAKAIRNSA